MVHYQEDYEFGIKEEMLVLETLKNYFKREIKKTEDLKSKHDFFDEEYFYELKSRKLTSKAYNTTMITEDKTIYSNEKKLILLFNFTDGLYYIEYNKEKFSTYFRQPFSRAGYSWDKKIHVYIPVKDLTFICKREDYIVSSV